MDDDQARWIAHGLDNISRSIDDARPINHGSELGQIACGLSEIAMAINRLADALEN